ncbi:MAG: NADH-quinone oxidoreductase subunit C [Candidatus Thorarchaeota archaeon]
MSDVNDRILSIVTSNLGEDNIVVESLKPNTLAFRINPKQLTKTIEAMLTIDDDTTLSAISCVDLDDKFEMLYHLRTLGTIATVRCEIPSKNPKIPSITTIIPGANFHERETADLFGVKFKGHPNPEKLIIPEAWPTNLFPLRKNAENPSAETRFSEVSAEPEVTSNREVVTTKIVIGPQHPALLEPERFLVDVDGETVTRVTPRIGYAHRGVEKATESRNYLKDVYLVERICGICNSCHSTTFCQAVETILDTEVPARGRYLRTIVLELNRIQSHLLLIGHTGHEIGYDTLFQYVWRDREIAMDLIELITGNRVITSFLTIGGVRRDITENKVPRIIDGLSKLRERALFYQRLLDEDLTLKMRLRGVGVLSREDAVALAAVGPVARASGIKTDVRLEAPYAAYDEVGYKLIYRNEGDSWARLRVRADELLNSIDMVEYAVSNLPQGDIKVRVPRRVPEGEAINRVEAPRGELFYYVKSNGTQFPERVKIRTPTFTNFQSVPKITEGENIADFPASFSSIDPCFSCTDR